MSNTTQAAILVLSCDKYADIWNPFFSFLFKFWNDCPYKIYLGTNELKYSDQRVISVPSGSPKDWSNDTISILQQIPEKYVIVILEDYFVYAKPDQHLLDRSIAMMEENKAVFMRIACFPSDHFEDYAYDSIPGKEPFVSTRKDARYRVNLQTGIWNREDLIRLIIPGESPWKFELDASERSRNSERAFLGIRETSGLRYVHGPIPYLCTALSRGVWMRDAIDLCRKNNIHLETGNRPVEGKFRYFRRRWYHRMPYGMRKYIDYLNSLFK